MQGNSILFTGMPGAEGDVPYERYQPGSSEKTITSLSQGK